MYFIVHNIFTQPNKLDAIVLIKIRKDNWGTKKVNLAIPKADSSKHTLLEIQVNSTLKVTKHPSKLSKTFSWEF